jgi:peroxin-19
LEGLARTSTKAIETETTATSKPKDPAPVDGAPDPEEDDLDDLDDMLDEFSATKIETKEPTIASSPGGPQATAEDPLSTEGISDDDNFAKQLQAGMADLLGELGNSPDMQTQFKNMLKELGGAAALGEAAGLASASTAGPSKTSGSSSKATSATAGEEAFQETIKKTMERMQTSGDQATAAAAADETNDILTEMMKALQTGCLEGEGGEEDFSKMLLGMMEQLTNKEILYEPMKELQDKFPAWMGKNKSTVAKDDLKRYEEQQVLVAEIVGKFEEKTYTDDNVADREYIVDRMQKMQAAGSPPADLVGNMAAAQEVFGAPEEGCPQQ